MLGRSCRWPGVGLLAVLCLPAPAQTPVSQQIPPPARSFEDELIAAPPAERHALILAHRDQVDAAFVTRVSQRGGDCFKKREAACAMAAYEAALAMGKVLDDPKIISNAEFNIGLVYRLRGELDKALAVFRKTLVEFERLHMDSHAANAEGSIANVLGRQGDYASSAEHFARGLALAEKSGDKARSAQISFNLGNSLYRADHLREALTAFKRSLELCGELNLDLEASFSTNGIGNIYLSQREYDLALDYYERSLKIKEKLGNPAEIAHTLINIALLHDVLGKTAKSKATYELALGLFKRANDVEGQSYIAHNLGLLHLRLNELDQAQRWLDQSVALSEQLGDRPTYAEGLVRLGELAVSRHEYEKAVTLGKRATALLTEMGGLRNLAGAQEVTGIAQHRLGLLDESEASLRKAVDAADESRFEAAGGAEQRVNAFDRFADIYRVLVDVLAERKKAPDLLAIAERIKARSLLELMRNTARTTASMTDAEKALERALVARLGVLNGELQRENTRTAPDEKRRRAVQAQIDAARREYKAFETELYSSHPGLKLRRADSDLATPDQLMETLPDDRWAAIQYVFGTNKLYALVVTRSSVQLRELGVDPKDTPAELRKFREQIATRDLAYSATARSLFDKLMKPLIPALGGRRNLVIVPDGALWQLPFAALMNANGKHLLEEYALAISPSLGTLREVRRRAANRPAPQHASLLAVGRGQATKGTASPETEAAAIGALWGADGKVFLGDAARENRVKAELPHYSVIHLSAHGVFDDRNALYSYVSLAPSKHASSKNASSKNAAPGDEVADEDADEDGLLEAREFLQLDIPADLVVLSACETARGKSEYAEGMVGLTWALTAAGARTTLASQWKVDADSTTKLMLAFHRGWKANLTARQPLSRAQVLRNAANTVMVSPYRRHPYYWAGFVLFGDGF